MLLLSCCIPATRRVGLDAVRLTATGVDEPGAFCADFSLTPEQVTAFFARATRVGPMEAHDLLYLPCFVRGRGSLNGQEVTWEVRAGGTGRIEGELYGCRTCDDLFSGPRD
jgi:hypothetical protein